MYAIWTIPTGPDKPFSDTWPVPRLPRVRNTKVSESPVSRRPSWIASPAEPAV